jgi:hypothetical protein
LIFTEALLRLGIVKNRQTTRKKMDCFATPACAGRLAMTDGDKNLIRQLLFSVFARRSADVANHLRMV